MKIIRSGYPDSTAFDPDDPHYDPRSTPDQPRWFRVDVKLERKFPRVITLAELKHHSELADLALLRRGNRLSIMPLSAAEWPFYSRLTVVSLGPPKLGL